MNRNILFFLKPLSFLPALVMMFVIFGFSAQDAETSGNLSMNFSYKVIELGNHVFEKGLDKQQIEHYAFQIEHPIRKVAHMTEYFILAVAVSFPFYVYGLRGIPLIVTAAMICVAFAFGDEYHQSFVDGRGPSVKDVGIDSIGVCVGILFVQIIHRVFLTPKGSSEKKKGSFFRRIPGKK